MSQDMSHALPQPRLTFEDAMAVHVLRAQGVIFSELTRIFGANPARFHEILCGNLHPGSWDAAVERMGAGETWHPEIGRMIERLGRDHVCAALNSASPNKKRFQQELKRLRKSAPIRTQSARRFLPYR